MILKGII